MRCNWIYICISDYGQSQEYHQVVDKIGKNETINGNTDYMKNIGIQCVLSLFRYLIIIISKCLHIMLKQSCCLNQWVFNEGKRQVNCSSFESFMSFFRDVFLSNTFVCFMWLLL